MEALLTDHPAKDSPAVNVVLSGPPPNRTSEIEALLYRISEVEQEAGYYGPSASSLLYDAIIQKWGRPGGEAWSSALRSIDRKAEEAEPTPTPPSVSQRTASGWSREYYKVDKTSTGKYSISCEVQITDPSVFPTDAAQDAYVATRLAKMNEVCRREVERQERADNG